MKIAIFSPHRDDAAFSLGLAIQTWITDSHTVHVLNCFTRSEYAPHAELTHLHANDRLPHITALRQREDETWRRRYGAALTMQDLGLKDAPLRLHCSSTEVCSMPVRLDDKAFLKIGKAVHVVASTVDAFLLPLALGSHVDHLTARDAARAAIPDQCALGFYEDLPYAARAGVAEMIEDTLTAIDPDCVPAFACPPQALPDAIEQKRKFALCYDSQVSDEEIEQTAQFCMRYAGRERLWVNPAWRASGLYACREYVAAQESES